MREILKSLAIFDENDRLRLVNLLLVSLTVVFLTDPAWVTCAAFVATLAAASFRWTQEPKASGLGAEEIKTAIERVSEQTKQTAEKLRKLSLKIGFNLEK